jgi:hypothetical protein
MALANFFAAGCVAAFGVCLASEQAQAQFVNPVPAPPPPVFNPSSPYTVPQTRQTPVSPNAPSGLRGSGALLQLPPTRAPCSVLSGRPCHPSFCDVFHNSPCFPQYLPPIGENLQLTIVSTDDNDTENNAGSGAGKSGDASTSGDNADKSKEQEPLDSIGEMYAALRACWVPPPKDSARHGMEYTVRFAFKHDGEILAPPFVTYVSHDAPGEVRNVYRDAVNATLARCTPLHFSDGMASALAGSPIAIRFEDNRTIDNGKSLQ